MSIEEMEGRLASSGATSIDPAVIASFGQLLPDATYLPLLIRVTPRLVTPVSDDAYFAHEQVATWGLDGFWGLPENPHTPYYRTFETAVSTSAHLYEFVVPMVPPTWNDKSRVNRYERLLTTPSLPTVVAVSTLDISAPAVDDQSTDYYEHWALTHFILDGHHKINAAAATSKPLHLLTLLSVDASLAKVADVERVPALRAQAQSLRRLE